MEKIVFKADKTGHYEIYIDGEPCKNCRAISIKAEAERLPRVILEYIGVDIDYQIDDAEMYEIGGK